MRRLQLTLLIFIMAFVFFQGHALADGCPPIYGGGEVCTSGILNIQKTVLNPQTKKLVPNLDKKAGVYHPEDIITFQIKVTNIGQNTLSSITVTDVFPNYITYSSGPGTFDTNSKTFKATIQTLKPNEVATITILGRVMPNNQITIPEMVPCVINQAFAHTTNNQTFYSTSQFCIEKQSAQSATLPAPTNAQQSPSTGSETTALLALFPTAGVGFWLRKITRRT